MKSDINSPLNRSRSRRRRTPLSPSALETQLAAKVIGQPKAMSTIVPYVQMHQAGLSPEGRPLGVFLLLGPTGTGKTRTVEALAEVLHGSAKNVLRIDCGEFQMDHEVARLVGAPPGYLGHRETHPMLSQAKVNSVASTQSSVSIVLFDEIEKAAPSMTRLMLGVLDKATLRLGDNNSVNFEKSMIFLTSNLGASKMMKEFAPVMGFGGAAVTEVDRSSRLESIAMGSAKRAFPPEFLNRVDATVTYEPLSEETLFQILEQQLQMLQKHIRERLGDRAFVVHVPKRVKLFLLEQGLSKEYGAREIKRTVHKHLMQPLAAMVAAGMIYPGSIVGADVDEPEGRVVLMAA